MIKATAKHTVPSKGQTNQLDIFCGLEKLSFLYFISPRRRTYIFNKMMIIYNDTGASDSKQYKCIGIRKEHNDIRRHF
jgi:hypothetical protein